MPQNLGFDVELRFPFNDAIGRVKDALKQEGFGILTEIDLQAAFREKLGREFRPYVILGACNPALAHRAVSVDRQIGLLLPCNVVVRSAPNEAGAVIVDAMDPQIMVQVADQPGLREVADDAAVKLHAAIDTRAALTK